MQKTINLDGEGVLVEMSADTLRVYRQTFGRDLMSDMAKLSNELDMEVIENLLYICVKACNEVPEIHEWLKQFSPGAIYEAAVDVISMWTDNEKTSSKRKKKADR